MAPLITSLSNSDQFRLTIAVTGQHREMLDQVNSVFGLVPDHDMDVMVPGASLGELSSNVISGADKLIADVSPDAVIVQGDTTSAFLCGLAAFYHSVPIVHVEAGLRTGNLRNPFPEEANRKLLGSLANLHLAPTARSKQNLLDEGVRDSTIAVTGNTVIDALQHTLTVTPHFQDPLVAALVASSSRWVLVTTHRRESWGEPMVESMTALRQLAEQNPEVDFLLPMHRNQTVRDVLGPILGDARNVHLTEPLGYLEFAHAMAKAYLILTDSGGVQEEAPSLGKPVLVMRDNTERPEAVDAGTVRLVGTDRARIVEATQLLLDDADQYLAMSRAVNPYGDGQAASRSVAALNAFFGQGERQPDFVV